jgi:hypothetical protein
MHSPLPNANQPLASLRGYFFGGAITSFAAFATRNFTTVLALILIDSPVVELYLTCRLPRFAVLNL